MKQKLAYWLMLLMLVFASSATAQTYGWWESLNSGNPGGVRTIADASNSASNGYSVLLAYNAGAGASANVWSATSAIPFSFSIGGNPVSKFCVNKNGLVTFDTTVAGTTVDTSLSNSNKTLPFAGLPNNTIAFWDNFSPALGSNDAVWVGTEGTAPNRQQWIVYHSYKIGGLSFGYFAVVLEESTNNIYLVDMNYASGTGSFTKGIQFSGTSAIQVTGSPNIGMAGSTTGASDNSVVTIAYGTCFPASGLTAGSVTASSFSATWSSLNTPIASQLRYRPVGATNYTVMTGNPAGTAISGLSSYTNYEWQVREICAAGDTAGWSSTSLVTTAVAPNWTEAFASYPPSGWTERAGRINNPTVFTSMTSSNWASGNYGNTTGGLGNGTAAYVNLYSSNHYHWAITPSIEIPNNAKNYQIEYDLALTPWTGTAQTFLGVDDTLALVVSLDNGATWNKSNVIKVYEPGDTILPTGIHEIIAVPSAWKGQTIKLGWYSHSTTSNTDLRVYVDNFSVVSNLPCAATDQCDFTVNMVDSWGDGWNGNTVSFVQGGNVVATVGSGFTSGSTATATITLCSGTPVTIQVGNLGSYSSEVGFSLVSPDGITLFNRAPGASFTASTVFGTVNNVACFTPACPVTDTLTVAGETTCGNSSVTFAAAAANPNNTVIWLNTDSATVGSGNSFTTPVLSATTTYLAGVFADDNALAAAHMGAPATLTGGFGNFTNGQWFTAQKPITIDSITVISNGASTFSVRISEAGGSIATGNSGALLQQSQWITVPAAGTHKVAVGLKIMPGTYFMNFTWQTGSGLLHRATAGATYPYTIAGVASIDSVQFGSATSQVRVYYAYDWVVSEGCVGPLTQATATWAAVPSTAIPYSVDFNSGLPCNWSATSNTNQNWNVVATYGTSSLNGSSFAFLDDDAAGFSAPAVDASLTSPVVNTLGYDSVTVSFDHYYRHLTGQTGYVEGYNGTTWVVIDSFTATQGSWTAPVAASYDVTAMANANFQVRFRFNDGTGVYGWYWAVDNFEIDGNVLPCTNVRVAVTTDIYGSEVSWSIRDVNTGIVWATGGPYADVTPYNAAAATHIDTLCLPDNGTYEFQINDSFGDGLFDGTNTGTYSVDKLCSWGWNNVITGSGAQPYGSTTNPPSYDSVVFDMNCIQLKNVTFQVDMNQVTQGFTTPEVNGFWNNWCGNCNAMSDANGDGIWEVTIPLEVGTTQEFKYSADAWTIQEMNDPTAPCTNGNATYTNRVLVVPAADTTLPVVCWSSCYGCTVDVTLQVNMAWEVANNAISADGIHVAGDFQGWNPGATAMTDANSDGIYEVTINVPANSSIQYKFINGNSWGQDEPVPSACAVTGTTNRGATFAYGDSTMAPVCFGKCTDCMASLDETLQNVSLFPNPTRGQFNLVRMDAASEVEVSVLDLQGKVLTVAAWNAGAESLSIDLGNFANGVYMVRLTSEEGSRTLRVSVQK